jgi:hypothetical protein
MACAWSDAMNEAQRRFGGVERLRLVIDLETTDWPEDAVIDPKVVRARIESVLEKMYSTVSSGVRYQIRWE